MMIPHTEYELRALLEEIYTGVKVVIPTSVEHAEFMIQVATGYLDRQHNNTLEALKADYGTR